MERVFLRPGAVTRWPLYLRQAKAVLRAGDESFDERRYGFAGLVEALRYGQREGLFRLDRDRQGVLRVYPGQLLQRLEGQPAAGAPPLPLPDFAAADPQPLAGEPLPAAEPEPAAVPLEAEDPGSEAAAEAAAEAPAAPARGGRKRAAKKAAPVRKAAKKTAKAAAPRKRATKKE
jgi:hypothetical protein